MQSSDSVLQKTGWALKKADVIPQWNKRFLVCDPYTCHLLYYRDMPTYVSEVVPRGSLDLTDCTVTITRGAEPEEEQCRFLVISRDQRQTYNLQVGDRNELKSWYDAIRLLSKLGTAREQVSRDSLEGSNNKIILLQSSQKLLKGLERKASECGDGLKQVAEQKWKAKCRLIELLEQLKKGGIVLQDKLSNLQMQEKELREKMHFLVQKEFFVQDEVSKSNSIQEKVVEAFYADGKSLNTRALEAMKICTPGPGNAPCDAPKESKLDESMLYEPAEKATDIGYGKDKKLPPPCNFRKEMLKVLLMHFPSLAMNLPKSLSNLKLKDDQKEEQLPLEGIGELVTTSKLSDTERTLLFFHSYFTKVHVAQEERLIQVRTQCQAKFHKLKWINKQRDLISREQSELRWITKEMKRAISRLTKEGVPLGPGEVDADIGRNNTDREKNIKDTLVPIRAHRATWSEASDVIFRLNFNRLEQYDRRKELESALTTREAIREFIGTIESTDQDELDRRIAIVESISLRRDSRNIGFKNSQESLGDDEMKA